MLPLHFFLFECELFWRYFDRVNNFIAQCGENIRDWEFMHVLDEGMNLKLIDFYSILNFKLHVLMRH